MKITNKNALALQQSCSIDKFKIFEEEAKKNNDTRALAELRYVFIEKAFLGKGEPQFVFFITEDKKKSTEAQFGWEVARVQIAYSAGDGQKIHGGLKKKDFSSPADQLTLQAVVHVAMGSDEEKEAVLKDLQQLFDMICQAGEGDVLKRIMYLLTDTSALPLVVKALLFEAFTQKNTKALEVFENFLEIFKEKSVKNRIILRELYKAFLFEVFYKDDKYAQTLFEQMQKRTDTEVLRELMIALVWVSFVKGEHSGALQALDNMVSKVLIGTSNKSELFGPLEALMQEAFVKENVTAKEKLKTFISKLLTLPEVLLILVDRTMLNALETGGIKILEGFCNLCKECAKNEGINQVFSFFVDIDTQIDKEIRKKINTQYIGESKDKNLAIHIAGKKGLTDVVRVLIKYGADTTLRNANDELVSHLVANPSDFLEKKQENAIAILKELLALEDKKIVSKLHANAKNKQDRTSLHIASFYGLSLLVDYLLADSKWDPTIKATDLQTPLHSACQKIENTTVIFSLLIRLAQLGKLAEIANMRDDKQMTPLMYVIVNKDKDAATVFKNMGVLLTEEERKHLKARYLKDAIPDWIADFTETSGIKLTWNSTQ